MLKITWFYQFDRQPKGYSEDRKYRIKISSIIPGGEDYSFSCVLEKELEKWPKSDHKESVNSMKWSKTIVNMR